MRWCDWFGHGRPRQNWNADIIWLKLMVVIALLTGKWAALLREPYFANELYFANEIPTLLTNFTNECYFANERLAKKHFANGAVSMLTAPLAC